MSQVTPPKKDAQCFSSSGNGSALMSASCWPQLHGSNITSPTVSSNFSQCSWRSSMIISIQLMQESPKQVLQLLPIVQWTRANLGRSMLSFNQQMLQFQSSEAGKMDHINTQVCHWEGVKKSPLGFSLILLGEFLRNQRVLVGLLMDAAQWMGKGSRRVNDEAFVSYLVLSKLWRCRILRIINLIIRLRIPFY